MNTQWATIAATSPPIVCEIIAFEVSSRYPRESSMAVCVLKKPLQHMPIAVNTAMALPSTHPLATKLGTKLNAAPTAPNAVMGKAI